MTKPLYIRMKANGLDCWHLVAVKPTKLPLLKRIEAGEAIDVTELGDVLESGWGNPPNMPVDYETIDA